MQGTVSEVITIDSDSSDEFECQPPLKRLRVNNSDNNLNNTEDALKKLDKLKEISTFTESHHEDKIKHKSTVRDSLTIIIEGDDMGESKGEIKNCRTITDVSENIVIIDPVDEETSKEFLTKPKENISNDCTVILDDPSEESEDLNEISEKQSEIKNKIQENEKLEIDDRPSTSTASEAQKLLDQFLETCATSIKNSKYETQVLAKFPKMREHFNNCNDLHNEVSLKRMIQDHISTAQFSAPDAVVNFQRIYSYLLDNINGASIEVPEENWRKVKKLEKACKLLVKKLKQLEEAEIDFEDENNSVYIQIDRYSQRLNKVFNKYCQLTNRNPHTGRLLYEKIRFVASKYDEINRAISKSYKHNQFPSYCDIEKCIRNCVNKNNLLLTEADIKEESKSCFTKLGDLLQLRRKKELYEIHCGFIALNEDPANNDPELKVKLQESLSCGKKRMSEVVEKYVKLQENNIMVDVSEDSDDSHYKNSDSDE